MSYHAIENLVEDAVHLIEKGKLSVEEKRSLIYNLYKFQNRFDTSYTVLRCFPYLEKISYIKKFPVDQHPDFTENPDYFAALTGSSWIASDLNRKDEAVDLYENGNLLVEYGSLLWSRLAEAGKWDEAREKPEKIPVASLIASMISLAGQLGHSSLMHNFYLAFVNGYLEFDIDSPNGIPFRFEDWLADPALLKLRELFTTHSLLKIKKKETDFEIPDLSSELNINQDAERRAKIRFLLDSKSSVEKIHSGYLKELKDLEELPLKLRAIFEQARQEMEKGGWEYVSEVISEDNHTHKWLWYKDTLNKKTNARNRTFTEIIVELELSSILAKQYVQHNVLLDWQGKAISMNIKDAHFEINLFEFITDEESKKHLNPIGIWALPIKSKQPAIARSNAQFLSYLTSHDTSYLDKIDEEFPEAFFSRTYQSYIDIFESDKPIGEFLLIANLYSISLLFIYKNVQDGNLEEALRINEIQESRLTDRFRENVIWYKEMYLPYTKAIMKKENPALPDLFRKN